MVFTLALGFHATERNVHFSDRAAAQQALDALKEKMGAKRWGENGERVRTYTITAPTGDVVVDLEKIECARLIDSTEHEQITADFAEQFFQRELAKRKRVIAADAEAKAAHTSPVSEAK